MGRHRVDSFKLDAGEIERAFHGDWEKQFPPVLTVEEAARLARVPTKTVYDWSHRGLLRTCAVRKGKRLRVFRDRFLRFLFEAQE